MYAQNNSSCYTFFSQALARQNLRAVPGIEPGTSPTLRENHTTRPNSQLTAYSGEFLCHALVVFVEESARDRKISFGFSGTVRASSQCSLAVEHPLSKREVVGSNPAIGYLPVLMPRGARGTLEISTRAIRSAAPMAQLVSASA